MYVDVDLSLNDDKTGVSGVWLVGRNDVENEAGVKVSLPTFKHAFSVAIQAPKGDKIPYMKVKSFLLWLRKNFNLERVSRDQFQSEYLAQVLESEGITVDKLSVDRTPDGYIAFRNVLIEKRIDLLHVELLEQELTRLERDPVTGKVDHPAGGSKDIADSLARCIWNAILHDDGVKVSSASKAKAISAINGLRSIHNSKIPNRKDDLNMFPQYKKFK